MASVINYAWQPYGVLGVTFEYNRLIFPDPYNDANLILAGPKIDLAFTRKLFLSSTVQYNNQIDNISLYGKLQWRFRPVSDIFLVYTDNYYSSSFENKNRALIFKFTYWI